MDKKTYTVEGWQTIKVPTEAYFKATSEKEAIILATKQGIEHARIKPEYEPEGYHDEM